MIVLLMVTSSQTLLTANPSVPEELVHFLAANGRRRITIVTHLDHSSDSFLQNHYGELSKSGKFYTRIIPLGSDDDHGKVSHEDFHVFTPNSVRGNLSGVVDIVSKTKVIFLKISRHNTTLRDNFFPLISKIFHAIF